MKNFLAFYLILCASPLFAQNGYLYNESFADNSNNWITKNTEGVQSLINTTAGTYDIAIKKDLWSWMTYDDVTINPYKPFTYHVVFSFAQGTSSTGTFGLTLNTIGLDDYDGFIVRKDGTAGAYNKSKGTESWKSELKPSGLTFETGKEYTLTVNYTPSTTSFKIDATTLCEIPSPKIAIDNSIGLFFKNKLKVNITSMAVLQDKGPINLVEGSEFSDAKKENLGSKVNTVYTEKKPIISPDGKTIYFIRDGDPANVGNPEKDDIWYTELDENGEWGQAQNLGRPINNKSHNSIVGIASDNSWMAVKHVYDENGEFLEGGFSMSTREGNGWSIPKKMDVKNYYTNSNFMEAVISPDGSVLMFTADREDTYGKKDIYISKKISDGVWSEPVNCGTVLNSYDDETGPFIAADNKTVYFASYGHSGYGSSDIFVSRRLDDTWTNWSTPENLGPTINTSKWDAYFSTDAKGEYGYLVSSENSIGSLDIFRIKLPAKAKPEILCVVKGVVINSKTSEPMIGKLTFRQIDTDSTMGEIFAHPVDGTFSMILKEGHNYSIVVEYAGYVGERISVDLSAIEESTEKEVKIFLKPIEEDQTIHLNNIFFEEDQAELLYSSKGELHHVANLMKEHPEMKILIGGHSMSGMTNEKFNQQLSKKRAKAVYNYLISLGVSKKRLKYVGYGSKKPVSDANSTSGNAQNRCVDFTILSL